ncbi:MAG: hypothetical protein VX320_03445 [Candidatus Thermoplasmatota archaeon]|nr:hypothetical protein [Candidatus Thermoplasmatota archaeon]
MRTLRGIVVALCAFGLFVSIPAPTEAQEVPEFIGWEMGFVIPEGESQQPFSLDGTPIQFWIHNKNIIGDIEIALEYDGNQDISGPESATVSSGQNDTFTVSWDGADSELWTVPAGSTFSFTITGELTAWAVIEVPLPISSDNIEGELIVPELHRWLVEFSDIEYTVNAGTENKIEVNLWNQGNTQDSISSYDLSDDCPLLTLEDDEMSAFVDEILQMGAKKSVNLNYDVSSTHPTRLCNIELNVRSTGVAEGGLGDTTNEGELNLDVEARPIGSPEDNDDGSTNTDDGPQNQKEVESDNFLFAPVLVTPVAMVLAALICRHQN